FYTQLGLPYPLAILGGIALTTLTGLILWAFIVLPLWRRRSPTYVVLLGTIVFGAILGILALLALGSMPQTLPPWLAGFFVEFGDSRIEGQYFVVIVMTLILMGIIAATLRFTRLGREMRACAASRDTCQLVGVSPERMGFL